MKTLTIPDKFIQNINEQAVKEYPNECCGMIFGPKDQPDALSRIRSCQNVQNDYHERDPNNFPRTAATAYFIDPKELLAIQRELQKGNEALRVIYHSHINADAYFSDEDERVACQEGEPTYPGVHYLVVSVIEGAVKDRRLFVWDPKKRKFVA